MRYTAPIKRTRGYAEELMALLRRRREPRRVRVRVRVANEEARVLPEHSPERERLLAVARELVDEYGRSGRGRA
jgi:hypothetical protein